VIDRFARINQLQDAVERRYWHHGWISLVDAGARNDSELRDARATEQIRRDIKQASFLSGALARYDALAIVRVETPGWWATEGALSSLLTAHPRCTQPISSSCSDHGTQSSMLDSS
jgi:hypothetical protein